MTCMGSNSACRRSTSSGGLLIGLVLGLLLLAAPRADATISSQERDALIALYNATNGAGWTNSSGWLGTAGSECSWYGVVCQGDAFVYGLELGGNNLAGTIPPDLAVFTGAAYLHLQGNQLNGPIPTELGDLSSLNDLALQGNQLSGPIPSELSSMTGLTLLQLQSNLLTGGIPVALASMTGLQALLLGSNQLDGSIPAELGQMSSLTYLSLENNQLTGPVPPELGNLTGLVYFYLQSNALSGPLPVELAAIGASGGLNLSYNAFAESDPAVTAWASALQPGWESTQTVAPANVQVLSTTTSTAVLGWTPIEYSADSGRYEVLLGSGNEATVADSTADKSASGIVISNLQPGTAYTFGVRTVTDPNGSNANLLTSEVSSEVVAFTVPLLPASVVIDQNPGPMFLPADGTVASTEFSIANVGGAGTTVQLASDSGFFTVRTTTVQLEAGASASVAVDAGVQPIGAYSGSVTVSGTGVPSALTVPVTLIVFGPPGATIPDIEPTEVRIDRSGAGPTLPGEIGFRNAGSAPATGVVVSEDPWLEADDSSPFTIAAGSTVTIPFTINRAYRAEPSSSDSLATTVRFVYPPQDLVSGRGSSATGAGSQPGSTVTDSPSLAAQVASLTDIPAGQVGITIPGVRSFPIPNGRLVSDLVVSSDDRSDNNLGVYLVKAGDPPTQALRPQNAQAVSPISSLGLVDIVGNGFNLPGTGGSLHLRSSASSALSIDALTQALDDARQLLVFRDTPAVRSDRSVGPGGTLYLAGVAAFGALPSVVVVQEMAGAASQFEVELLDASGAILQTLPRTQLGRFGRLEQALPALSAMATIVVRNTGSAGRVYAFCEEGGSKLDLRSLWDPAATYGASRTAPSIIPYGSSSGGATVRARPIRRNGSPASGAAPGQRTELALFSPAGARVELELRTATRKSTTTVELAARQTRFWSDAFTGLFKSAAPEKGVIVLRPLSGEVVASAWLSEGDSVLTLPVLPLAGAIGANSSRTFQNVIDHGAISLASKVGTAMTPALGLAETSGSAVNVEVTVSYYVSETSTAGLTQTKAYNLAAGQVLLLEKVVREVAGAARDKASDLYNVSVKVRVRSGTGKVVPFLLSRAANSGDYSIRVR